ncbi:MAG: peptidylprolyl isomerase [Acidobacteria bacterium]|nr:peptidylprolyl isomerase [Acidobacteriota bacterium]
MKMRLEPQQDENQLFDLFVEQEIFLHLADRDQVEIDEEDVRENLLKLGFESQDLKDEELLRSVKDDLRVQKWIKANISSGVRATVAEAEDYYRRHSSEFVQLDTVHLREILISDQVFAQKLYRQLRRQPMEDFLLAARKYSKAASAANDGDLGTFQRGELPDSFEQVVFRLRPGEISAPVRSDLGYHLFLLEERVPRHRQTFLEVKDEIFEKIMADKESQAIRNYLEDAKKTVNIQVYRKNTNLPERKGES